MLCNHKGLVTNHGEGGDKKWDGGGGASDVLTLCREGWRKMFWGSFVTEVLAIQKGATKRGDAHKFTLHFCSPPSP